jgi:hypothetical protein
MSVAESTTSPGADRCAVAGSAAWAGAGVGRAPAAGATGLSGRLMTYLKWRKEEG